MPRDATEVLCIDPRTEQATLVGDQLPGGGKWAGGVLAADGNIYGIPYLATQVLRFDPRTQQATLVGDQLPGRSKWQGGVLAADGNIYGIPHKATQVLRFDPRTQQATLVGDQLPGNEKWLGGVLAADGNIYGIPHNATQVLRFTTPVPEGWTLDVTLAAVTLAVTLAASLSPADNVDAPPTMLLQPLEALSLDADELRRVTAAAVAFCRDKEADSFAQLEKRASRLTGPMLAPQVPPCLRQGNTPLAHKTPPITSCGYSIGW
jgi:hypothetical protein